MYIKIYTKSQLILLRYIRPILKEKYLFPQGIFEVIQKLLKEQALGKHGFVAIILQPVENDMTEIRDILNLYPRGLKIAGDIEDIRLEEKDHCFTEDREWYMDTLKIRGEQSKIFVIYSMTLETLYGERK